MKESVSVIIGLKAHEKIVLSSEYWKLYQIVSWMYPCIPGMDLLSLLHMAQTMYPMTFTVCWLILKWRKRLITGNYWPFFTVYECCMDIIRKVNEVTVKRSVESFSALRGDFMPALETDPSWGTSRPWCQVFLKFPVYPLADSYHSFLF